MKVFVRFEFIIQVSKFKKIGTIIMDIKKNLCLPNLIAETFSYLII
jgi:hypothetical protein